MAIEKRGFKIGDRVVIVKSPLEDMIGVVTTIVSILHTISPGPVWRGAGLPDGALVHDLEVKSRWSNKTVAYPPDYLELYRDDGQNKVSWEDLPSWVPRTVKANASSR